MLRLSQGALLWLAADRKGFARRKMRRRRFIAGAIFAIGTPSIVRAQSSGKPKRVAMVHASEKPSNMTVTQIRWRPTTGTLTNSFENNIV